MFLLNGKYGMKSFKRRCCKKTLIRVGTTSGLVVSTPERRHSFMLCDNDLILS